MPTNIEYALLAGASYASNRGAINQIPVPVGWSIYSAPPPDGAAGFESFAFTNSSEIVIGYAGTDFTTKSLLTPDMRANFALGTGAWSIQLLQAAEHYLQVKATNSGVPVMVTGQRPTPPANFCRPPGHSWLSLSAWRC